jgi:hypothetical protein
VEKGIHMKSIEKLEKEIEMWIQIRERSGEKLEKLWKELINRKLGKKCQHYTKKKVTH